MNILSKHNRGSITFPLYFMNLFGWVKQYSELTSSLHVILNSTYNIQPYKSNQPYWHMSVALQKTRFFYWIHVTGGRYYTFVNFVCFVGVSCSFGEEWRHWCTLCKSHWQHWDIHTYSVLSWDNSSLLTVLKRWAASCFSVKMFMHP